MNRPADQAERDRFSNHLDRNFSVVASAGSGKTRAITDRIKAMACNEADALTLLSSLVVVTFTNRAADEMQARARQSLLEAGVSLPVLAAFNRAFFGTIHSFCVTLLRQHGHHLGLAGHFETINDDDALWMQFVQQHTAIAPELPPGDRAALLRLVPVRQLMELGRNGGCERFADDDPGPFPDFNFDRVYGFQAKAQSRAAVERSVANLRRWETNWKHGKGFAPLPICESNPLRETWQNCISPIRRWACRHAQRIAARVEHDYRAFRLARGVLGYDDQVRLARDLTTHPEAASRIRAKGYRVILDEAQDTDPTQFSVLLEVARPPEAKGQWPDTSDDPPRPGHFCMVGDFQQSIYGDRSDLAHYRKIHDALVAHNHSAAVTFSVTFRLDRAPIDLVNGAFPTLLTGEQNQASFVPLRPRPGALGGQVLRWTPPDLPALDELKDGAKARIEADRLARWLRETGREALRAERWNEVAILCPRKEWFVPLRAALRARGFTVQIQSERDVKGDSPAYAWFTALAVIMAEPGNTFEIIGVLREIFGLSDQDLGTFAEGYGARFELTQPPQPGRVGETLTLLSELRQSIASLPLFDAMQEVIRITLLRDRLLTLPKEEYDDLDAELASLLTLAAAAEADGQTLCDFATSLRDGFTATREVRATTNDAVQLITSHKAKGSEWQCVIVPMFARPVRPGPNPYPRLVRSATGTYVAFSKEDLDDDTNREVQLAAQQQSERLLYVTLTRARHTLVLCHDDDLFQQKTGVASTAQASRFRCTSRPTKDGPIAGENAALLWGLASTASACPDTTADQKRRDAQGAQAHSVAPLPPLPPDAASIARDRATHFIKRNPSALAESALAEADRNSSPTLAVQSLSGNAATSYGLWWHGFVERLDWRGTPGAWDATFAAAIKTSPNLDFSHREWSLLRAALMNDDGFTHRLTAPGLVLHAEMPFLWRMNENECLEGIIDLAIFDPAKQSWLVLDWKTNRTGLDGLLAHYAPQLAAYWKMLSEMTGLPVEAGLYSTVSGKWLPYEASMLADAWNRLAGDPRAIGEALSRE